MISKEDILPVAKDLNFLPTEEEIKEIIAGYELESEEDPTGNLPIWIESLLYSVDVKKMDTIAHKGKKYPTRTFEVNTLGMNITISTVSLEKVLNLEGDEGDEQIDNDIYFYVEDEQIHLTAEEICKSHLDEEMIFVEEQ